MIIDLNLSAFGHVLTSLNASTLKIESAPGLNVDAQYTAVIKGVNTAQTFYFGPLIHGKALTVVPTYTADGDHMESFIVGFQGTLPNILDSVIKITG